MPRAARPTSMPIFKLKNMFTGKWASRRRTAALVVVKAMWSVKIYGHVGTSGAFRNDSDTSGTCTGVGMKSQSTGELEDQRNVADVPTVRKDGQSVSDDTKTAKNTRKMIRMR